MRAVKVKLGSQKLVDLAKQYPLAYPAKLKEHDGRIRLIIELQNLQKKAA